MSGAGKALVVFDQPDQSIRDLLLFHLISNLSDDEKAQIGVTFGLFSRNIRKTEKDWLKLFQPHEHNSIQKAQNLVLILANYGLTRLIQAGELNERKAIHLLRKQTNPMVVNLYKKGVEYFKPEQARALKLVEQNLFPIDIKRDRKPTKWCSVLDIEDEKELKEYCYHPPINENEMVERDQFFEKVKNFCLLLETLMIPKILAGTLKLVSQTEADSTVRSASTQTVGVREFEYLVENSTRTSLHFAISGQGILRPIIASLLVKLFVWYMIKPEELEAYFTRVDTGIGVSYHVHSRAFDEIEATAFAASNVLKDSTCNYGEREISVRWQSIHAQTHLDVINFFMSFLTVDEMTCLEFIDVSKKKEVVESVMPHLAELVKAYLQITKFRDFVFRKGFVVTDEMLPLYSQFFMDVLNRLLSRVDEFESSNTSITLENIQLLFRDEIVFEQTRNTAENRFELVKPLKAGDRPLSVNAIVKLENVLEILRHLSNFSTWKPSQQQQLVDRFAWQRFLEKLSHNQALVMLYSFIHGKQGNSAGSSTLPTRQDTGAVYWHQIIGKLDFSRREVDLDQLHASWHKANGTGLNDLCRLIENHLGEVYLTRQRFQDLTRFPHNDHSLSMDEQKAKYPFESLLFARLGDEGIIDWDKQRDDPLKNWIRSRQDSVLYWLVLEVVSAKHAAKVLMNSVPAKELCPHENRVFPNWAEIVWEIDRLCLKKPNPVPVREDAIDFVDRTSCAWYLQTKRASATNAELIMRKFLQQQGLSS